MARQQSNVARARIHSPNHAGVSQESLLALHPENPERFAIADFGSREDHLATWRVKPRNVPYWIDPDTIPGRLIRTEGGVQPVPGDVVLVTVGDLLYMSIYREDKGFVEEANPVEPFRQDLVKVCGVLIEEIKEAPKKPVDPSAPPPRNPQFFQSPADYIEDITCTSRTGDEWNARWFVPHGYGPEHADDELGAFRLALSSPRVPGLYFSARVRTLHGGEAFPHDSLPIFDCDVQPHDGDVVCAVAFVKDADDTLLQRAFFELSMRSNAASRWIDRLNIRIGQRESELFLLRRYVLTPDGPHLESLDGSEPAVANSRRVSFEVLGVATKHKPFAAHRCGVMF